MSKSDTLEILMVGGPKSPEKEWPQVIKNVKEEAHEAFLRAGLKGQHTLRAMRPFPAGGSRAKGFRIQATLRGEILQSEKVWGITFVAQPFGQGSCWLWLYRLPNGTDPAPVAEKIQKAIESLTQPEKSTAPVKKEYRVGADGKLHVERVKEYVDDPQLIAMFFNNLYSEDEGYVFTEDVVRDRAHNDFDKLDSVSVEFLLEMLVKNDFFVHDTEKKTYAFTQQGRNLLADVNPDVPEDSYLAQDEPVKEPAKAEPPKRVAVPPLPKKPEAPQPAVTFKPVPPMVAFKAQLDAVPPALEEVEIYQRSRDSWKENIGEAERKASEERKSIIMQNPDYYVRVLRFVLAHHEWSEKYPPVIRKKYMLDAIECAYPDIITRNDGGRILKAFEKRKYFEEVLSTDAYAVRPEAYRALRASRVETPKINEVHNKVAPPAPVAKAPPAKTVSAPVTPPAPIVPAPVVQKQPLVGAESAAAYMRAICAKTDVNGEITRDECVEILEQFGPGAGALFDSLVEARHLSSLFGTEVFQIDERWLKQPKFQVTEGQPAKIVPPEAIRSVPVPKQEERVSATPAKDLFGMIEKMQRGKTCQQRLAAIDREIGAIQANLRLQADRLAELSTERSQAQAFLDSPEYREAVEYVAQAQKKLSS